VVGPKKPHVSQIREVISLVWRESCQQAYHALVLLFAVVRQHGHLLWIDQRLKVKAPGLIGLGKNRM
jgi:hypothetical protein